MFDPLPPESMPLLNGTGGSSEPVIPSQNSKDYVWSERSRRATKVWATSGAIDSQESDPGDSALAKSEVAKYTARASAASTSKAEESDLRRERAQLLNRQMREGLNSQQQTRLEYVRWNLDQIESARIGPSLDRLELAVNQYKSLLSEIRDIRADLRQGARSAQQRGPR